MLRGMANLKGYSIGAIDGVVGHVSDFYFDDRAWVIRYFVVETGAWLSSRSVLIPPICIDTADWAEKLLKVSVTKRQIEDSPDIDTDKPVSRQREMGYLGYYGRPCSWANSSVWGANAYPYATSSDLRFDALDRQHRRTEAEKARAGAEADAERHKDDDHHLRSYKAIKIYHIHASDGDIGHVSDLLVSEDTWAIRFMVVNTAQWWFGHQVLVAPERIIDVSWPDRTVTVNLTRGAIKLAPHYAVHIPREANRRRLQR
jgi:hypothetical protein